MLSCKEIDDILTELTCTGGDYAEVFVEKKLNTSLVLLDGVPTEYVSGQTYGVSLRIFYGEKAIFAYSNETQPDMLINLAQQISRAIPERNHVHLNKPHRTTDNIRYTSLDKCNSPYRDTVEMLRLAYNAAADFSPTISRVVTKLIDQEQSIQIATSEGRLIEDSRSHSWLLVDSIASRYSERHSGPSSYGALQKIKLMDTNILEDVGRESARLAIFTLEADECPSGLTPVILEAGVGGIIFHEACGHALEATSVAHGKSVFSGRIGEQIAPVEVTLVDDGSIPGLFGSLNIDDEGEPTRKNVLIENGILRGYLIDKLNARRMGQSATGSARKQSYNLRPTSRMTNTYLVPGKVSPSQIFEDTDYGLYVKKVGGGQSTPITGGYHFTVTEGYIVRNGKLIRPIRGATLMGTGPETLAKIDMVGDNIEFAESMCGSISGHIPVTVGQPTIRVSELMVSGRKGS